MRAPTSGLLLQPQGPLISFVVPHLRDFRGQVASDLQLRWYLVMPRRGGHKSSRVLAAKLTATLSGSVAQAQELKLTALGRTDLRRVSRVVVSAIGTFTPAGGTATAVTKTFVLKR